LKKIFNNKSDEFCSEEQKYKNIESITTEYGYWLKTNKVLCQPPQQMHGYEQEAFCGLSLQRCYKKSILSLIYRM
jgi:hypothetical protein